MSKKKAKTTGQRKKMPGECTLEYISCGSEGDERSSLKHYYAIGGHNFPSGEFKGQVSQITKDNRFLFKKLYVKFDDCYGLDCYTVEAIEDHLWIYDGASFAEAGVKVGDCVSFSGLAYAYRRKDGTVDFGLKECCDIQIIPPYGLPDMQEVERRDARHLAETIVCETCLYSSQCDGLCLAPPGYKEEATDRLLSLMEESPQKLVP